MAVLIRAARPSDERGVGALLEASYPPLLASAYDAKVLALALPAMTRANPRLLTASTWYVAELDGQVVGCGGWTPERPGTGAIEAGVGHARHFGTHVDHLRRGIGRAIGGQMLSSAREAGIERLECYATLVSEAYYASLGFRTQEAIEVPMPRLDAPGKTVPFPALWMMMTLDRARA